MILLLGGRGYVGGEFARQLEERNLPYRTISHIKYDYTDMRKLTRLVNETSPTAVINCAGFTGKPNVDSCELTENKNECKFLNVTLPVRIAMACEDKNVPWLHVSSGCIYAGGKVNGEVVKDLRPHYGVDEITGFTEEDEPNFNFRHRPCSYYSGTKSLAETDLKSRDSGYICRLRIPFEEESNSRNYLTKLINYPKYYDNVNSMSHKREFVSACLDIIKEKVPYGIYNIANPGFTTTEDVVNVIKNHIVLDKEWSKYLDDEEFYKDATAPRSNCVLDMTKLTNAGIAMRPLQEALEDTIKNYEV